MRSPSWPPMGPTCRENHSCYVSRAKAREYFQALKESAKLAGFSLGENFISLDIEYVFFAHPSTVFMRLTKMGLCDDCKVLEFDEKNHGGYSKENEEGEEVLWFDVDRQGVAESRERKRIHMKYRRDVTLADLESMVGVCEFCSLIRQGLLEWHPTHDKYELRELWYEWESGRLQWLILGFWIPGEYENESFVEQEGSLDCYREESWELPDIDGHYHIWFELSAEPDNCARWLSIEKRTIPEDLLSSEGTVSTMKKWMTLDAMEESSTVPTRLIDVSPTDDAVRCRLVHTSEGLQHSGPIKYAALSHCWGDATNPPLKTTKAKIHLWQREGFSDKDMPATYQDAVKTVRKLDIRYLWIDSLCIVQDDIQDWEREAVKMSEIYQGAAVTIVPIASKSCHDGFSKRSPAPTAEVRHSSSLKPGLEGKYFLREPDWCPEVYFGVMEQSSTWATRGWTFQEGVFAVKKFYFGQQKMLFESHGKLWAEDDPQRMANGLQKESYGFSNARPEDLEGPNSHFIYRWYAVIGNYTKRKLSFESDRLPGVSSYAKALADTTGRHYLAGLWREELHRGLLWQTTPISESELLEFVSTADGALVGTGHAKFIAPSWSWARGSGAVNYRFYHAPSRERPSTEPREALEAVMVDAGVEVDGLNEFGRVSSGYIRVSGKVRRLSEMTPEAVDRSFEGPFYEATLDGKAVARCWTDWIVPVQDGLWMSQFPKAAVEGILMLLLVPRLEKGLFGNVGIGLLLLPTEKAGIYRRVGLFEELGQPLFESVEFEDVTII